VKLKIFFLSVFIFLVSRPSSGEDAFPFIGLTPKGKSIEASLSKKKWKEKMEKSISYISQSALTSLERIEGQQRSPSFEQVDIGSSIKISLGLGTVVKGSIEPYFKLFFKKRRVQSIGE
tara:strand:+ start:2101 stop:2457 length:357 start_codon:yes stop_codon:yes gene_type:complete